MSRALDRGALRCVYVSKRGENVAYTCQAYEYGWRCGRCGRGLLGVLPKVGKQCRVCKSKVSQVVTNADAYADSRGFHF